MRGAVIKRKTDTRTGKGPSANSKVFLNRRRPIHLIGLLSPDKVTTTSPILSPSILRSPSEMRMLVPRK